MSADRILFAHTDRLGCRRNLAFDRRHLGLGLDDGLGLQRRLQPRLERSLGFDLTRVRRTARLPPTRTSREREDTSSTEHAAFEQVVVPLALCVVGVLRDDVRRRLQRDASASTSAGLQRDVREFLRELAARARVDAREEPSEDRSRRLGHAPVESASDERRLVVRALLLGVREGTSTGSVRHEQGRHRNAARHSRGARETETFADGSRDAHRERVRRLDRGIAREHGLDARLQAERRLVGAVRGVQVREVFVGRTERLEDRRSDGVPHDRGRLEDRRRRRFERLTQRVRSHRTHRLQRAGRLGRAALRYEVAERPTRPGPALRDQVAEGLSGAHGDLRAGLLDRPSHWRRASESFLYFA